MADVDAAKADAEAARIQLDYTEVDSPIYVDVAQSSAELLRLRRAFEQGDLQKAENGSAKATLMLEDRTLYPEQGSLQFSDSTVDESTGTITLRALFPNHTLQLLPGMFVHARLEFGVNENAILIPQQAVTFDTKGQATTLIVGAEDKIELRVLQVSRSLANQWLVTSGLQVGDRVITEGLQRVRPGIAVKTAASQ